MKEIVKFPINTPVEVALRFELGRHVEGRSERIALTWLVNAIYRLNSRRVLEQYGWRCAHCGGRFLLQIHHRRFRSHGGTHRTENLEPVCGDCHRRIHSHQRNGV